MTKLQSALSKLIIGATLAAIASPASAWWQFVANGPNAERQVSQHYRLPKSRLAKRYPDLFPLVGSCEQYR